MPKMYREADGQWVVPGKQTKNAMRFDVPSGNAQLADWLNIHGGPTITVANPMEGEPLSDEDAKVLAEVDRLLTPPSSYIDQSVNWDEQFPKLPVDHQLHFAAMAVENARARISA